MLATPPPAEGRFVRILVCAFRRPNQLARLLSALDVLTFAAQSAPPRVEVVVLDNSPAYEARSVVADHATHSALSLRYVEVGAGNISVARNRGLDEIGDAQFAVWLDDDEVPAPAWLDELLVVHDRTGAAVVVGPVLGRAPERAPTWLGQGRFFDALEQLPDLAELDEGITGNVLMEGAWIRSSGLRFEEALGLAGGEDQVFFRRARAAGVVIRFAAAATVWEDVPPERLRVRYLLRREYRKGNTLGLLDRGMAGLRGQAGRRVLAAAWWSVTGLVEIIRAAPARDRTALVVGAMRASRAMGMTTGLLRIRFDHYAPTPGGAMGGTAPGSGLPSPLPAVMVLREDPSFQMAGHTFYLLAIQRHLERQGRAVSLLVTGARVGRLVRRRSTVPVWTRRSVGVGPWDISYEARTWVVSVGWRVLLRAPAALRRAIMAGRSALRSGRSVDHVLGSPLDPATETWLLGLLAESSPCLVFFDSVFSIPSGPLPEGVRSFVITHDVVSERARSLTDRGYSVTPGDMTSQREADLLARAEVAVAINDADGELLRQMTTTGTVGVVVTPVPVEQPTLGADAQVRGRCLFVGSGSLHNVDAMQWFLEEVWPQVLARAPYATLEVAGSVCSRLRPRSSRVVLRGGVDDLTPLYAQAEVVIVPLRAGSGLKVKTVESLVRGRAVVSTSIGVQGLEALEPAPFEVADDAAGFAESVTGVLDSQVRRERLEAAGRAAAPSFRESVVFSALDESIRARDRAATPG